MWGWCEGNVRVMWGWYEGDALECFLNASWVSWSKERVGKGCEWVRVMYLPYGNHPPLHLPLLERGCYLEKVTSYQPHIITYLSYCHVASYHIMSYDIIWHHIISHHIISSHIISYHLTSYHITSYIVLPRDARCVPLTRPLLLSIENKLHHVHTTHLI